MFIDIHMIECWFINTNVYKLWEYCLDSLIHGYLFIKQKNIYK